LLIHALEPTIMERHQQLEIRDFQGSDTWIYGDPERLYQGFQNILENAVKYTPDHGQITVDGRTLPGFIEVTIADTGIGITSENQTLIFRKFSQAGPSLHSSGKTKFKGGGPGLGLPITRGIMEAHGGTIWVESEGCDEATCPGSIFHVLIPARNEPLDPKIEKILGKLEKVQTESNGQTNPPADPPTT